LASTQKNSRSHSSGFMVLSVPSFAWPIGSTSPNRTVSAPWPVAASASVAATYSRLYWCGALGVMCPPRRSESGWMN